MNVGFIGLGKMGRPMTQHLLQAGHTATVHNRSRPAVDALVAEGAQPAKNPAEVAQKSDVVFSCLTNNASIEDVYFGPDGLLSALQPGQVLVDHSTAGLDLSRRCAAAVAEKGGAFLDAPVSGGPAGAQAGTLTIMVGGDQATFDRVLPLFEAMGKNIRLCGPSGSGTVVKLANQLLVGINTAGVVEAMVLAVKAGADPQVVLDMIGTSFGGSTMMVRNVPMMLKRNFAAGTPVSLVLKDLGLISELASALSVRLLMGAQAREIFGEARALGFNDEDMSGIVRSLEKLANVEVVAQDR
jgi:3-hydroxyisobutyrate dehydrogenase-like beta-hydroxyacid dehydrogenase